MMIYVFWIISLGLLYYFLESRKKNRINELIDLIENMGIISFYNKEDNKLIESFERDKN